MPFSPEMGDRNVLPIIPVVGHHITVNYPPSPRGYDTADWADISHPDCIITFGFDTRGGRMVRFVVRLHYQISNDPVNWDVIARLDHNETPNSGHDLYQEGLHIDVKGPSGRFTKYRPKHSPLPPNTGALFQLCFNYLKRETQSLIDIYNGNSSAGPPKAPDGGLPPRDHIPNRLMTRHIIYPDMSREPSPEDPLSHEEVTELVAEATGTTAEEIARQAEEVEVGPIEEAELDED